MKSGQNKTRWFVWVGVAFLQLIMTQVVTFLLTNFIANVEQFQQVSPVLFMLILGGSFSAGVFLIGWLALKLGWLKGKLLLPLRLTGTVLGAFIPLIIGLIIYKVLVAGNMFFAVSILFSILGFHVPGWFAKD